MKPWEDLGVGETIYEEECEETSTSTFLSPSLSSPSCPLHCKVDEWSKATGCEPNVLIRVQDSSFHLHKDPLTTRSIYFKRQLNDHHLSQLTISPPLNIAPETFTLVAYFCYGTQIVITPSNIVALRVAAELLGMTEIDSQGNDNLRQITENYFCRVVSVSRELTSAVFRSCLPFLPEAETTAFFMSRCVEPLGLTEDGGMDVDCLYDVKTVCVEKFQVLLDSMRRRLHNHDVIYTMIHIYIEENNGKITEEQKNQICGSLDCEKLSPNFLVHAVQNPKMPLQFIVRAMFIDHLNTRRSIFTAAAIDQRPSSSSTSDNPTTLGAILQRDAALRQVAQLKKEMESTGTRIKSLEKELLTMKSHLKDSEKQPCSTLDSARSMSFSNSRTLPLIENEEMDNSIMKTARSASSNRMNVRNVDRDLRFGAVKEKVNFGSPEEEFSNCGGPTKFIGQKFIVKLRNVFRKRGSG